MSIIFVIASRVFFSPTPPICFFEDPETVFLSPFSNNQHLFKRNGTSVISTNAIISKGISPTTYLCNGMVDKITYLLNIF